MKTLVLKILSSLLLTLLLFSVFKNISYPLMWGDEAMSAVGAGVVLEYGYPKVHGEKNVFYDFLHTDPTIGINQKDDSFAASSSWGQYYYGIIGYLLADFTDDIYAKTGIIRSTYAIMGLLGLLMFVFIAFKLLPDKNTKYVFLCLFILMALLSISLTLHIRQVRYYSLALFLASFIVNLYMYYRFYKPLNIFLFIVLEILALWLLFVCFSPVYFILLLSIGLSELLIFIFQCKKADLKQAIRNVYPLVIIAAVSMIAVIPMMIQVKYFEISAAIAEMFGYTTEMYFKNLAVIFNYFKDQDYLLLAIALKIILLFTIKKKYRENQALCNASAFLTLFFILSCFILPHIPQVIWIRYLIYLHPVLFSFIIFDFIMLVKERSVTKKLSIVVFAVFFFYTLFNGIHNIRGHIYEMTHQSKGPLDYTIPYIKDNFQNTDTLIIATNYEEYSFMYYLNSKVIIGYVGNNLEEDMTYTPDIISYRSQWPRFINLFNYFLQRSSYTPVSFPVFDSPVNDIPELDNTLLPLFNHRFKTQITQDPNTMTYLFINNRFLLNEEQQ